MKGFAESPPLLFVFIGNFQSTPFVSSAVEIARYREAFDQLAALIAQYPYLASISHFVFVPGPNDPWAPETLPRPPLPSSVVSKLRGKVRNTYFPGNPCRYCSLIRIKYFSQDIVVFREDLVNVLSRNAIFPSDITQDLPIEKHVLLLFTRLRQL